MECRDKAAVPPRKLVQARLPFKRLNPVPKEKIDVDPEVKKAKSSPAAFVPSKDPSLDASLDDVENELGSDRAVPPQLLNGKGPLDHFIQKNPAGDTSGPGAAPALSSGPGGAPALSSGPGGAPALSSGPGGAPALSSGPGGAPALSKGSDHGLRDGSERGDTDSGASATNSTTGEELRARGCLSSRQSSPAGDSTDPEGPCAAAEEAEEGWGAQPRSGACKDVAGRKGAQGELKDLLFEGKVPVVLLEDIMTLKSPQDPSGSPTSGPEALESSHEGDSGLSRSSLSSGSSPGAEATRSCSPLAASTPTRKVPQKFHRSSAEKEKLRLQRDQERADKLQRLQAEREEKGRLKEEAKAAKERAKEEAKKRKEEEKELKEKERREKKEKEEKEKAEKLRVKEEKRKERQEALEAKLEEKRKKEEEKRLKEEEKRLNAQKAEITRFFQKPKTPQAPKTLAGSCGKFAPFEIKENMVLAPLSRVVLDPDYLEQLDKLLHAQNGEVSFLRDLKCRKPRKTGPTLVSDSSDSVNSDVVVVDNCQTDAVPEREKFGRMKLLQFSENHRPAYWGTWNKSTSLIRARNPWAKDTKLLDYEVDSDEEWEEEEPGESLSHSEEDDEEEGEDEDEDDGFFVPHGYLSEDEGVTEECDPENQKVRQKLKAKEWDELIAKGKRFHVLQPVKIGCVWEGAAEDSSTNTDLKVLQQFTACVLDPPVAEEEQQTQKCSKKRAKDQQILAHLLPLLHGNVHGSKVIIHEFQECCRRGRFADLAEGSPALAPAPPGEEGAVPSKARLKRLISESSVYEKRPEFRMCWYVHAEVLRRFGRERLPVPCRWSYVTRAPCAGRDEPAAPPAPPAPPAAKRKALGSMSITKFMKRPRGAEQAAEMDGFQADTEEDEEDDDCMIVDVQPGKGSTASESSGTGAAHQDSSMVSPSNTI
ncbi:chromatin assembly factor 1 subunit A [Prinia subflava]|uniref:chromatin assembly factor 1 subunit A n=1 Tax=Prinia subflava TaxID=208062 RepID=UPI002FE09196